MEKHKGASKNEGNQKDSLVYTEQLLIYIKQWAIQPSVLANNIKTFKDLINAYKDREEIKFLKTLIESTQQPKIYFGMKDRIDWRGASDVIYAIDLNMLRMLSQANIYTKNFEKRTL